MRLWIFIWLATIPLTISQAQTELGWKFIAGESHEYRLTQTARLNTGSGERIKQIADVAQQIDFNWKVVEVTENGTATISIKVKSYTLTAKGPDGQEVAYDSLAEEHPQGYAAMLVPIDRRLTEEPVQFSMTPQGKVNILDLPTDLADAVKSIPGGKLYSQDGGVASFESLARLGGPLSMPPNELREETTWKGTNELEVPAVGKLSAEYSYEVSEVQSGKPINISQSVSFSLQPDEKNQGLALGEQTSTGAVLFDQQLGRPDHSSLSFKINLIPAIKPADEQSEELMTIEQNIKFTSLSDTTQ